MKKNNIWQFLSDHGLVLVIVLAFVYRIIFFVSLQPWSPEVIKNEVIIQDAREYHPLALSIISNKSFEDFTAFRTPGYPVFLAIIYSISSSSVWLVLLVQIFLSLVSAFLVYKIAALFLSHKVALLSVLLFSIDTTQAVWTVELYSETLYVLLFLSSVYFLCRNLKENKFFHLCISALFLGIATLVKPVSFMFPVVVIIVILLIGNVKITLKLLNGLVYVLVFLITISPWLLHNYTKHGEAKLSSITGFNLLLYNVAYTEVAKTDKTIEEVRKEFNKMAAKQGADTVNISSFKNSDIYTTIAKQYIKDNLFFYTKRHLMGTLNMFAGLGTHKIIGLLHINTQTKRTDPFADPGIIKRIMIFFQEKPLALLIIALLLGSYLVINYLFSLYGVYVLLKYKEVFWVVFILIILYFSALTGVVGYDRYRVPFMPFINILCAIGIFNFYEKISVKSKGSENNTLQNTSYERKKSLS